MGHHGLTLPFEQPQDLLFSRDRIGVAKYPDERVHEGSGQAPQCQVDGSMGKLCLQILSAMIFWCLSPAGMAEDPHITPSAPGLGIPPLSLPPLPSPCPIECEARGVEQRF